MRGPNVDNTCICSWLAPVVEQPSTWPSPRLGEIHARLCSQSVQYVVFGEYVYESTAGCCGLTRVGIDALGRIYWFQWQQLEEGELP
ncbi:MAG TPA: hypothetical protein VHC22_32565 [Pirellulales bacterium]|nr:hypothetical protein [Pirellulales bacterium]